MLVSFHDALLQLSKTNSPQKLFPSDCITLYVYKFAGFCNKVDWLIFTLLTQVLFDFANLEKDLHKFFFL